MNGAKDTNEQQIKEALCELKDTMRNLNDSLYWKTTMKYEIDTLKKNVKHFDDKQLHESRTSLDDGLSTITTVSLDHINSVRNDATAADVENKLQDLVKRENDIRRKEHDLMMLEQQINNRDQSSHHYRILNDHMWSCEVKQNEITIQTLKTKIFHLENMIQSNHENSLHLELEITHKNEIINDLNDKLSKDDPFFIKLGLDSSIGGWALSHVPKRLNKKYFQMIKPGISNIKPRNKHRLHKRIT